MTDGQEYDPAVDVALAELEKPRSAEQLVAEIQAMLDVTPPDEQTALTAHKLAMMAGIVIEKRVEKNLVARPEDFSMETEMQALRGAGLIMALARDEKKHPPSFYILAIVEAFLSPPDSEERRKWAYIAMDNIRKGKHVLTGGSK